MAKISLRKGSGKRLKVREKSVKNQGILKWILSGNPVSGKPYLFSRELLDSSIFVCTESRVEVSSCSCHLKLYMCMALVLV